MEELFVVTKDQAKVNELAEEYMQMIFDVQNKDSRIKLLKLFMGLGEERAFTQKIGQVFANMMLETHIPFDEIFTGDV